MTIGKHGDTYDHPRQTDDGFDIQMVDDDGVRRTMLGFKTEADAEEWIRMDKAGDGATKR